MNSPSKTGSTLGKKNHRTPIKKRKPKAKPTKITDDNDKVQIIVEDDESNHSGNISDLENQLQTQEPMDTTDSEEEINDDEEKDPTYHSTEENEDKEDKEEEEENLEEYVDSDDSTEKKKRKRTSPRVSKRRSMYEETPNSSYRLKKGVDSILKPYQNSEKTRVENFTDEEDRIMFRVIFAIYGIAMPQIVDKRVYELLTRVLPKRAGQLSSVRRRFNRLGKFSTGYKDLDKYEKKDEELLAPYRDKIEELREKLEEEQLRREERSTPRRRSSSKKSSSRSRSTEGVAQRLNFDDERESEEELQLDGEEVHTSSGSKRVRRESNTPNYTPASPTLDEVVDSGDVTEEEVIEDVIEKMYDSPQKKLTHTRELLEFVCEKSGKKFALVAHALYACSGNVELALKYLNEDVELTEEDKSKIWTVHDSGILVLNKRDNNAFKAVVKKRGKTEVEKRLAWLEEEKYTSI
ncbi:hypothetical protein ABK040_013818 [Willaertia magna]